MHARDCGNGRTAQALIWRAASMLSCLLALSACTNGPRPRPPEPVIQKVYITPPARYMETIPEPQPADRRIYTLLQDRETCHAWGRALNGKLSDMRTWVNEHTPDTQQPAAEHGDQ